MNKLEELKQYRKLLVNIDMVNGFVKEGPLHDIKIGDSIFEQVKLINKFIDENQLIAFIKDTHLKDSIEFKNFPPHCIKGTSEAELVDELKEYEKLGLVYLKNSTSALFAPNMLDDIESMEKLEMVVGTGCCTDICVLNFLIPLKNYFNERNQDVKVCVIRDATDTFNIDGVHDRDYYNKIAYELMNQAGIIVLKDLKELETFEKGIER